MSGVTIDVPDTEDLDDLADLWVTLATGQQAFGSHILSGENRAAMRERMARHAVGESVLVARDDGLVGFVTVSVESGILREDVTRGLVENLYVVPARRGEGIGSALLSAAEDALDRRGVDVIRLNVMAANERARAFYQDHGYDPHRVELEKRVESDTHSKDDG